MIVPQRALVRPRAISPESGQSLPLEELVLSALETRPRGSLRDLPVIQIAGGPGSGKSTALAHLAAVLPRAEEAMYFDDHSPREVRENWPAVNLPVICAHSTADLASAATVLKLAPWSEDDLIEYLLAAHPQRCGSVLARLRAVAGNSPLAGSPEICRPVLDAMAADESLTSIRGAVERVVVRNFATAEEWRMAGWRCLVALSAPEGQALSALAALVSQKEDPVPNRLLRHAGVQLLLASAWLYQCILEGAGETVLDRRLPKNLVCETARFVAASEQARSQLLHIRTAGKRAAHPMAASLLVAAGVDWRPWPRASVNLHSGYFSGVRWPGTIFPCSAGDLSTITQADFSQADLSGAMLNGVQACRTCFRQARLQGAKMNIVNAWEADFSSADLSGVDAQHGVFRGANLEGALLAEATLTKAELSGARLVRARLMGANLEGATLLDAKIEDADFRGVNFNGAVLRSLPLRTANLQGATFDSADLSDCDLEGVELERASFYWTKLCRAWLTGSRMTGGNFFRANLRDAGLAEISWEHADLREADLHGCSFHLGSTRSGLVFGPAGHGSKTGFYTDEYLDQTFKNPEEIRKANLCGADLRGAKLTGVDFYLVDLRGAKYDAEIREHLELCGAILHDRS